MRKLGGIDILVNNAGGKTTAGHPPWFEVPWADWVGTYEQNVGAAVRLIHHFAPGMKERRWGRIIQIASAAATQPEPGIGEYQAAKAALVNLTAGLARSLAHTGITVNTVSPGTILTPAVQAGSRRSPSRCTGATIGQPSSGVSRPSSFLCASITSAVRKTSDAWSRCSRVRCPVTSAVPTIESMGARSAASDRRIHVQWGQSS